MSQPTIFIFEKSYNLVNYLIKKWIYLANEAIAARGLFSAALSGGKTPVEFYTRLSTLSEEPIWEKTHLFQTDERFLLPESPDNNWAMIQRNLLSFLSIPDAHLHPMKTTFKDVEKAAQDYQNELQKVFKLKTKEIPIFDLMFLGMGEDGHIASLFPTQKDIDEDKKLVVGVSSHYVRYERISLTLPVINSARHIIFMITGKNKAKRLAEILIEKKDYPATRVVPAEGELIFLLDKDAASELSIDAYTHEGEAIIITRP